MNEMSKDIAVDDPRAAVVWPALRRLLRPVVRLLIAVGIPFPALAEALKELYVTVASSDFPLPGKEQTHSRISLLTGVHRKDVKRLLTAEEEEVESKPRAAPRGAILVGRWLGDPQYQDETGQPLPLPRTAPDGTVSFEALVSEVSKDVRPRAVLDEWLSQGLVRIDGDHVILDADALTRHDGFADKAHFLGQNLGDHAAAAVHNVLGLGEPMFERAVFYNQLSPASVEALRAMVRERAGALLVDINREAQRLEAADAGNDEANQRFTFGTYFFRVDVATETQPSSDTASNQATRDAVTAVPVKETE